MTDHREFPTERIDWHAEAAEELIAPVSGRRRFYSGFYDRAAGHGDPVCVGPGAEEAMAKFRERERQRGLPGVWRHNAHGLKRNKGKQRDIDYAIMEWI